MTSNELFVVVVIFPLFVLASHIFFLRVPVFLKGSAQKDLISVLMVCNILAWMLFFFMMTEDADAFKVVYFVLSTSLISYCYFHIFNMSETARRIKVLLNVLSGKWVSMKDVGKYYSETDPVSIRLERLEALGQISKDGEGNYCIKGTVLKTAASVVQVLRRILGLE